MKKLLYSALVGLSVLSCSKMDPVADSNLIGFKFAYPATKATASAFESGDMVSIYAVENANGQSMPLQVGGNYINNEKVIYDGSSWSSARSLYWSDNPCDFYALYPYQPDIKSIERYPFSLAVDQNGDGYEQSDLLYGYMEGVGKDDGSVDITFGHIMSKLIVNVVKGSKFEGNIPDDIVVHIYNTNVDGYVNLQTGSIEKNSMGAKKTITMKKISNEQFEAVVIPQNLEKRTPLIEISMGGIAYLLEYSLSFRAAYVHTVDVTLNTSPDQEQIEISIDPGINPWQ